MVKGHCEKVYGVEPTVAEQGRNKSLELITSMPTVLTQRRKDLKAQRIGTSPRMQHLTRFRQFTLHFTPWHLCAVALNSN
jgi:hypothetical protein